MAEPENAVVAVEAPKVHFGVESFEDRMRVQREVDESHANHRG